MDRPLWQPSQARIEHSNLTRFIARLNDRCGTAISSYDELHAFSVERQGEFWSVLWDFCDVRAESRGDRTVVDGDRMPGARYFPDARLNFAENLLRRRDDATAIRFRSENVVTAEWSFAMLHDVVSRLQAGLASLGLDAGDRVAAVVPNAPETLAAMLATASLGAIWSSCSPDFGERGILDRFGQIEPKVLVVCDGYHYNGKRISIADRIAQVVKSLPTVERVIVFPLLGEADAAAARIPGAITWDAFLAPHPAGDITFAQLPFSHPLYILFSSGTTGAPKCIVHSAGGVLLKHLSEHQLHCDFKPGDRVFYFTTCGWMMWNWLVTALASGCTLMLYDGSPLYPSERTLFDYAEEERITCFGTSAKFIDTVSKTGWRPRDTHTLSTVRTILSTGSPLAPESFDFVYDAIKADVHLASISGGTDLCGCFVLGNPTGPVWRGEIQAKAVGMAVEVWDDGGRPLQSGKGELVCTRPFPSMPVRFWNDPDGSKYHDAYFARFPNVWCHGDFAEWTAHGGMIIHGRSDATLNPGGVRIGTAEIYAQVEAMDEVLEALAIGQNWQGDVRVVLFVRLRDGITLDDDLADRIRKRIRSGASPRHVPARIVQVADIPRTKSGKISEIAVRDIVHGREVKNKEALANPEALDLYRDLAELRE